MARITNTLRDSIIASVLSEIPNPLGTVQDEARNLIQEAAVAALPLIAQPAYKLYPNMFRTAYVHAGSTLGSVTYVVGEDDTNSSPYRNDRPKFFNDALREKVHALEEKALKAKKKRDAARSSLRNSLYGLTTVKQLKETFPQFSKYLPEEMNGPSQPLNAMVVTETLDALRALGWKDPTPAKEPIIEAVAPSFVMGETVKPTKRPKKAKVSAPVIGEVNKNAGKVSSRVLRRSK